MTNREHLDKLRHVLIDMDGVLWRGNEPMPGLAAFFSLLRQRLQGFSLATNNASRPVEYYVRRLESFGVQISADEVITSAQATAAYLAERSAPGTPVYIIGENGLRDALIEHGFNIVGEEEATYVVVGWDRHVTYEKLAQATLHINAGATFIATNPDRTWPGERGQLPGTGAILAAVQTATDVEPIVIGKPSPLMLRIAMRRLGAQASTTAMIGDRLETDILGGLNTGLTTILVLSGIATPDDLAASAYQPDLVYDDISALTRAWMQRTATRADE